MEQGLLLGHRPGSDQPWSVRLGKGVWYSKDQKQPVAPGNITDDVP